MLIFGIMIIFEMSYLLETYTEILAEKSYIVDIYFKIICMEGVYVGKMKQDWLGNRKFPRKSNI